MPPARSSRTACQTTFLWIIPDMRDSSQPRHLHPTPRHGLAFIISSYWLHMAKANFVFVLLRKKGAAEIAESCVLRRVLKGQILARFARVAWRRPGGRGNKAALSAKGVEGAGGRGAPTSQ